MPTKIGARNNITGTVTEIKAGGVMVQVNLHVSGEFDMASVMTIDSKDAMQLKTGDKVRVIVKAVNVLLEKD